MKNLRPALFLIEIISFITIFFYFYNHSFTESYHYDNFKISNTEGTITIQSPKESLHMGIYDIKFKYSEDSDVPTGCFGSIQLIACKGDSTMPRIECDNVAITNYQNEYKFRAHVLKNNIVSRIQITSTTNAIDINNLELEYRNSISALYYTFCALILFILIDFTLLFLPDIWKNANKKQKNASLAIAITSIVASMPLFKYDLIYGHDISFHLTRIASIADGIKQLQLPVRLESLWANNYGYSTGMCYGGMLLYLPAILFLIGFSLSSSYKIFLFISNVITAIIAYICFKKIARNNYKIGIISMILYTLSMYRLVDVYTRAALGEYCAIAFIPLILYASYELLQNQPNQKSILKSLILGFTGLIETHILSTFMITLFLIAFSLCYLKRFYRKPNIITIVKASIITTFVNIGFIVPFLDYYLTVPMQINSNNALPIQAQGAYLTQLFQWFSSPTNGSASALDGVNEMPIGLGVALSVFIVGITCIAFIDGRKYQLKPVYPIIGIIYTSLFMSTVYFPYNAIEIICPFIYSFIGAVQFPWRYIVISTCLCIALFAYLMSDSHFLNYNTKTYSLIILLGITIFQGTWFMNDFYINSKLDRYYDSNNLDKYTYFMEYQLDGTTREKTTREIPKVTTETDALSIISCDRHSYDFNLEVTNISDEASLIFPVWAYKGMRADSETCTLDTYNYSDNNQLAVKIPAGYSGSVHVYFKELWYWRLSEIISILAIIICCTYLIRNK